METPGNLVSRKWSGQKLDNTYNPDSAQVLKTTGRIKNVKKKSLFVCFLLCTSKFENIVN